MSSKTKPSTQRETSSAVQEDTSGLRNHAVVTAILGESELVGGKRLTGGVDDAQKGD
eukprot:CAMPEP_0202057848 /NCGR_PEP_ID=MMETSP0963-20130614/29879_1 /ASSEMBLY_ACC=CAM_ASM_000494 /TAXON_ID=4773 /ORGANISM="Schizochytrium aggregatum, Strain ATCC28209" /LENGTH=56 /DNA_ID=CAMNT_0048623759 /DNA_START=33 /DNA_END=202 /DNA_ORIENTATION=-